MPTIALSPAFLKKMPAADGLLHSTGYSFRPDHLDQKDRGTITTKARDHSDSTSSESRSEQAEGGGRVPLLRGHHFQRLFDRC